jgi:Ca2+-binding RTX toxin-like protein
VTENAAEGWDLVYSSITYTLGSNTEALWLTGTGNINGTGNSLDNQITGNSGNNILRGYAGNDTISGGSGSDSITGGTGSDILSGGAGSDTFVYTSNTQGLDTITDFTIGSGNDLLDLTALGITADADHLRFTYDGANTTVSVDIDGGVDNFVDIAVLEGVNMTLADGDNYDV